MQSQTIDLLQRPRALRLVRALADELIRHETLGGADVRRVLERAERRGAFPERELQMGDRIEPWPLLRCTRAEP
ncbi:MAG TPA: hypothetical protein VFU26_13890 [Gaiellaceae bacterium]|nr:hypothetical protein [Gaiellaceae bacterium]